MGNHAGLGSDNRAPAPLWADWAICSMTLLKDWGRWIGPDAVTCPGQENVQSAESLGFCPGNCCIAAGMPADWPPAVGGGVATPGFDDPQRQL